MVSMTNMANPQLASGQQQLANPQLAAAHRQLVNPQHVATQLSVHQISGQPPSVRLRHDDGPKLSDDSQAVVQLDPGKVGCYLILKAILCSESQTRRRLIHEGKYGSRKKTCIFSSLFF